jgi:N-carbamoylputrescine amidase
MAVNGADLIFIPHASPRGTPEEKFTSWMRHLTARAFDNSLFIVACNQTGENGKGLHFPGIAVIIGPLGDVIEKKLSHRESLVVADLKSEDLDRVRGHRMRYFLPNRRTDLYDLAK